MNIFKKQKATKETPNDDNKYQFPESPFNFTKSNLKTMKLDEIIGIVYQYEAFIKSCEKVLNKANKSLKNSMENEYILSEKLQITSEELKVLKTDYSNIQNQTTEFQDQLNLLKQPLTDNIDNILVQIHECVFQITSQSTAPDKLKEQYCNIMAKAETTLRLIENQNLDSQQQVKSFEESNQKLNSVINSLKGIISTKESDLKHYQNILSEKVNQIDSLEKTFKARANLTESDA